MNENGVALGESEQALQKVSPVRVLAKNFTALDSAADDVVPAVLDLNANWPRYLGSLAKHALNVKGFSSGTVAARVIIMFRVSCSYDL